MAAKENQGIADSSDEEPTTHGAAATEDEAEKLDERVEDIETAGYGVRDYVVEDEVEYLKERIENIESGTFGVKDYILKTREDVAKWLAKAVTYVFAVLIIATLAAFFVALFDSDRSVPDGLVAFVRDTLPVLTTLLGLAFGFYFSEKRHG